MNAYQERIHRVNCLSNELDAIYHQAARKLGISDSVMLVLYMLYERGGTSPLLEICAESGTSKQTINSALRKLEKEEILYLEQEGRKTKRVCLTEKGKLYVNQTAARLFQAECSAFDDWTDEEVKQYLTLMEKYNESLRKQVEKI